MENKTNIFEKSIALSLEQGRIGVRRKVASAKMSVKDTEDQPDASAIAVNKEIISCNEFDKIVSLDNCIRLYLYKKALPAPFKRGVYLVPLAMLETIDGEIEKYKQEREIAVESFLSVYSQAVLDAKKRLGALYSPYDYPPLDTVRGSFSVRSSYLDIGAVPGKLGEFSPEIFQREQREFKTRLTDAANEIQTALRESMRELVSHMAERLTPDKDGKPKIFRDSLVLNLREFLNDFQSRNIANDSDLENIVGKARAILNGKNPDALRDNDDYRAKVADGMKEIKSALDTMITNAPSRKFDLE